MTFSSEQSAAQEPYAFFAEVLAKDLPITSFLASDFVVVNERLAQHYGIEGVKGAEFRRVAIRPEHHRGGVLGMAGVLTYLTDGFRTLPVRRAAYVVDTLWNDPAKPPPPNAGDLPPVKGKNLTLTLVHTHAIEPAEISIQLRDGKASEGVQQTVLTHEKLNAHNTFENPNQVMPKTTTLKSRGSSIKCVLPPASITRMDLRLV